MMKRIVSGFTLSVFLLFGFAPTVPLAAQEAAGCVQHEDGCWFNGSGSSLHFQNQEQCEEMQRCKAGSAYKAWEAAMLAQYIGLGVAVVTGQWWLVGVGLFGLGASTMRSPCDHLIPKGGS